MTSEAWRRVAACVGVALEVGLIILVLRAFQLETEALGRVAEIAFFGFLIHAALPLRFRLSFFAALSLVGIGLVLGFVPALWLIGLGLLLIAIAHLPVPLRFRIALLLGTTLLLVLARTGKLPVPWSAGIWPILGSMFMFRLIIYMYDQVHGDVAPSLPWTLSYFFLLPNVAAPLFPVVDYRTFRRTYYNEDAVRIYRRGARWMFRGLLHLILYRAVYYYAVIGPDEVQTLSDLGRFLISNYLLLLRISGLFHFFVGMLLLFGFNLPETFHAYFLASGFTDFWRRANIYWKDFMMKVFYYPSFFRLRRIGTTKALVGAMVVVFVATWLFHSYQWFWIRGTFLVSIQDTVYWSLFGVLVIANGLYENRRGRRRSLSGSAWKLREVPVRALRILGTFVIIAIMWSFWTSQSLAEWTDMWSVVWTDLPLFRVLAAAVAVLLGLIAVLAIGQLVEEQRIGWSRALLLRVPAGVLGVASVLGLYILVHPQTHGQSGSVLASTVRSLRTPRLNRPDQALLERGYYENLLGVERTNVELWNLWRKQPANWRNLWQTDAVHFTNDQLGMELVPGVATTLKGRPFTTNRWGMRDRDYDLGLPPHTRRVALLGSSPTMGSGVGDDETFERLLEERLNGEGDGGGTVTAAPRVECLNFAVDGYTALQQVLVLERKVMKFRPETVLYIAHQSELEKTLDRAATLLENRVAIELPTVMEMIQTAGVDLGTKRHLAFRRLRPHGDRLLAELYRQMVSRARAAGAVPIWVYVPMPSGEAGGTRSGGYAAAGVDRLSRIAEKAGFLVVDLSHVYGDRDLSALWVNDWDRHPNATAHRLIADALYESLGSIRVSPAARVVSATPGEDSTLANAAP